MPDRSGQTLHESHGRLWEVTPWLEGAPDRCCPPDPLHLRLAFTGLAAFHQRLAGEQLEGFSPGLRQRYEEISQLASGGFNLLEAAISRQLDRNAIDAQAALDWLCRARSMAPLLLDPLDARVGLCNPHPARPSRCAAGTFPV